MAPLSKSNKQERCIALELERKVKALEETIRQQSAELSKMTKGQQKGTKSFTINVSYPKFIDN